MASLYIFVHIYEGVDSVVGKSQVYNNAHLQNVIVSVVKHYPGIVDMASLLRADTASILDK